MRLTLQLNDKCARDILTTAAQQGCAYWANDYKGLKEERDAEGYTRFFEIGDPIEGSDAEGEPPLHRRIGVAAIKTALQRLVDTAGEMHGVHPKFVHSILAACDESGCGADAMECDTVLQMAVFERVIYG